MAFNPRHVVPNHQFEHNALIPWERATLRAKP
jgi:hypothetical protein